MRSLSACSLLVLASAIPAQQEADYVVFGSGCPTLFGVPVLEPVPRSFPILGETLTLRLRGLPVSVFNAQAVVLFGFSKTQWGPDPLPLDLSRFGLLGCTAYVSTDAAFLVTSPTSTALYSFEIPDNPALLGLHFFNQALVQATGANPFNAVLTNAGEATIGEVPRTIGITETFDDSSKFDAEASSGTWGNSQAIPGNLGGDGRHGSFDPTIGTLIAPDTYRWDTDNTVIPGDRTLSGQPETITDGRFFFTDFIVAPGTTVEFTGSKPVQIFVWGQVAVGGTVRANAPIAGPFRARPSTSVGPISGQPGGLGGPGGAPGGRGADSGDGNGNQPAFNGEDGEDVRLPAGHAYLSRAIGTGGRGTPQFPATGLNTDVTFGAIFGLRSGMIGAGGGGGGFSSPGSAGMAVSTSTVPTDVGPPGAESGTIDLFADAMGSLPPGTTSLDHFAIGGSGGGGGGSHPLLGASANVVNAPLAIWRAGAAGTGGGGALAFRTGGGISVAPTGIVEARGGEGRLFNSSSDNYPMPGGGGSGGTILLQSDLADGIALVGLVDTSGGRGSSSFATIPGGSNRGGDGSSGFVRMETPDGSIQPGNTIPSGLTGGTGVLLDRDAATGTRSLWYATGQVSPFFLRYEVEAVIDSVPMLFSDAAAVSAFPADDPNALVHVVFQSTRLDASSGLPQPGSIGPWRRYVGSASGQLETLNLDDGNAFRFQVLFNRDVAQDVAVTRVSVFYY